MPIYSPPLVYLHALEKQKDYIPQHFEFAEYLFSKGYYTYSEWTAMIYEIFKFMELHDDVDAFLLFVVVCKKLVQKKWYTQAGVLYHFGKQLFDTNHPHINTYMMIMSNFAKPNSDTALMSIQSSLLTNI